MRTQQEYLTERYRLLSDRMLMDDMQRNIRTAKSFRHNGGTGDTWLCEAWDQSKVLEYRGYTVREDWAVLNKNGERVA